MAEKNAFAEVTTSTLRSFHVCSTRVITFEVMAESEDDAIERHLSGESVEVDNETTDLTAHLDWAETDQK